MAHLTTPKALLAEERHDPVTRSKPGGEVNDPHKFDAFCSFFAKAKEGVNSSKPPFETYSYEIHQLLLPKLSKGDLKKIEKDVDKLIHFCGRVTAYADAIRKDSKDQTSIGLHSAILKRLIDSLESVEKIAGKLPKEELGGLIESLIEQVGIGKDHSAKYMEEVKNYEKMQNTHEKQMAKYLVEVEGEVKLYQSKIEKTRIEMEKMRIEMEKTRTELEKAKQREKAEEPAALGRGAPHARVSSEKMDKASVPPAEIVRGANSQRREISHPHTHRR